MAGAKLNNEQIAITAGEVTVFNYHRETREYLSSSVEFLASGIGIPANSCTDAPVNRKEGYAVFRTADLLAWELVADHRGETVFSTTTGEKIIITEQGEYPENTTLQEPPSPYVKWNGNEWMSDTEAQHAADIALAEQHKTELLAAAQESISLWQTELQLGIISDEDKARLIAWLRYIKTVQALDVSKASDLVWPEAPQGGPLTSSRQNDR
ncbi:tail fiber assembly protein [Erwinia amylovora]|uniref:tail fiber assembly protein n=1 Tax=Erwinia amylovora TaxID=552 RepID=UPI0014446046|nr:tail fiber assembly protein [Erwinia amylovora]